MRLLGGGVVFPTRNMGLPTYASAHRFGFRVQLERDDDLSFNHREAILGLMLPINQLEDLMEGLARLIQEAKRGEAHVP